MPALKCMSCDRWTFEDGCSLQSYHMMKKCMADKEDYFKPYEKRNTAENNGDDSGEVHAETQMIFDKLKEIGKEGE